MSASHPSSPPLGGARYRFARDLKSSEMSISNAGHFSGVRTAHRSIPGSSLNSALLTPLNTHAFLSNSPSSSSVKVGGGNFSRSLAIICQFVTFTMSGLRGEPMACTYHTRPALVLKNRPRYGPPRRIEAEASASVTYPADRTSVEL